MKLTLLSAVLAVAATTLPASAGPVADQLRELGSNVSTPAARPNTVPKVAAPETSPAHEPATVQPDDAPTLPEPAQNACLIALQKIADAEPVSSPDAEDSACVIDNPVQIAGTLGPTPITFTGHPVLTCDVALRLARFSKDTLQPLAEHHVGASLTAVFTGPGFTCRRRNNAATGKLSEHAFGKGIDITAFSFEEKDRLNVRSSADMKTNRAAFFSALRTAACGHFTTVLGPGTNAAHATHLHLDTGRMEPGKENPYRICQ
jgi:hypothetical protein